MPPCHRFLCTLLLLCMLPVSVWARCEGVVVLSTLQDAYNTALTGPERMRTQAAKTLLVLSGDQSGDRLARQVARSGVTVDVARLTEVLEDARTFATQTLRGPLEEDQSFDHGLNVNWLEGLVAAARCQNSAAKASLTPDRSADARATLKGVDPYAGEAGGISAMHIGIFVIILVGVCGGAGFLLFRTRFMRARQVERLPRFPITMMLDLTFTTPQGEMQEAEGEALDVSQGGIKLRWEEPPPPGTLTTLTLLGMQRLSRVIWANTHYAGLMFDTHLTKAELKSLKESYAPS